MYQLVLIVIDSTPAGILAARQKKDERLFHALQDIGIYVLYMFIVVSIATFTLGDNSYQQATDIKKRILVKSFKSQKSYLCYFGCWLFSSTVTRIDLPSHYMHYI